MTCYVKREDELGFGISGSKIRKYRTLIPYLVNHKFKEIILIGSAYSNHVLSLLQLLIENDLTATLFLRGDRDRMMKGNALLTNLFTDFSNIHYFSKTEWKNVEIRAHEYAKKQNHLTFVLPEGGFCSQCFPGALTLSLDILQNEQDLQLQFDHLFIDAGTGFTACALILAMHWLKHHSTIHVILLAEKEEIFMERLFLCQRMFEELLNQEISLPKNFKIYYPQRTKGFGKVPSFIFQEIRRIAQTEGFLTDPIYSAKLFIETKDILTQNPIRGNVLLLHSGRALTLMGFQEKL